MSQHYWECPQSFLDLKCVPIQSQAAIDVCKYVMRSIPGIPKERLNGAGVSVE